MSEHIPTRTALDSAQSSVDSETAAIRSVQADLREYRKAFFEKIALTAGATIALSVNFSGVLQAQKAHLGFRYVLIASWCLLILAMKTAILRNWLDQDSWFYKQCAPYVRARIRYQDARLGALNSPIVAVDESGRVLGREERESRASTVEEVKGKLTSEEVRVKDKSAWAEKLSDICGVTSVSTLVFGLALLVIFASLSLR